MVESDPLATQRHLSSSVVEELTLAGFEDATEIGHGGFGIVYRCLQPSLERTVAVKVLTSARDSENLERFLREQRAMGRLTGHPNIVHVLQVGVTQGGLPYIVMEYHPRGSMESRIQRDGPFAWAEGLQLGVKLAGALEIAHRFGILHRDVKPANILLTEYGEPQLTDFGIAHVAGGFNTVSGVVTGTPAFIAPEVLNGEPPSPASDIYSLGASLFCAITGHAAFERRSDEQILAQFVRITSAPIPDLRERGIPDDVCANIESAMNRNPNGRPASAAVFGDELRRTQRRNHCPVDVMALGVETEKQASSTARSHSDSTSNSHTPSSLGTDESSVPPPAPGDGVRNNKAGNLPSSLTSFVDRRRETTEARRLLSQSRLVTLTGVGGVGKTRLALRVAENSRRAFDDGVWFAELGELQDPGLLTQTISGTLGLQNRSVRPPLTVLTEYLAKSRILLVLDNCEHLVEAVAVLAGSLLRSCRWVRILATSREPLGIQGEMLVRVPALSVPELTRTTSSFRADSGSDAVTLFEQRAIAAVPGFRITEDNTVAVAQICQRLEGLPLPIELAAARLRAMSVEQIVQRLDNRLRLLTMGSRGTPTRQQTLRLCIDWSYDLCSAKEQWLWARLAVFAGGFELDAAEGILAGDPVQVELLDLVAALVDKSILIREAAGTSVRYRLLDTIRDYGREKLQDAGEYLELRRRHRDWYEHLVLAAKADWIGPGQPEWIARLEREQPNLRDAMEFCLAERTDIEASMRIATAMYHFWIVRGLFSEGRRWLDRALSEASERPTIDRVEALCAGSMLAALQNDIPVGTVMVEEARRLANRIADVHTRAAVTYAQGCLHVAGGDLLVGVANLEEAIEVFRDESDLIQRVPALVWLSLSLELLGEMTRATAAYQELITLTTPRGEAMWRAMALSDYGFSTWQQGDHPRGTGLMEEGLRLSREVGSQLSYAWALEQLAWTSVALLPERAAVLMGAADALFATSGSPAFPSMATYHDECTHQARKTLGERSFQSAVKRGKALHVEEAIAFALGESPCADVTPRRDEGGGLTRREQQVADLVAHGLTNKAIADKLVIAKRTVDGHVEHVLVKLGFTSRAQIAAWVTSRGPIPD